jgi:hypothetical protein
MHSCLAKLRCELHVAEIFREQLAWEGTVHVFDLEGHPTASTAYAWFSPVEGSDRRRFYAVLGIPPINSAADAVRAAIVADHKEKRGGSEHPARGRNGR